MENEFWGFGPGGNETGLAVFELPESVAANIREQGVKYFANMPPNQRSFHDWRGRYSIWHETPVAMNKEWEGPVAGGEHLSNAVRPTIANYLDRYGFGVPIEPAIESMVDDAILKPGNFYSYGRIGVIIVMPDVRRVVYAYNG